MTIFFILKVNALETNNSKKIYLLYDIEYDPNPLLSIGKKKPRAVVDHPAEAPTQKDVFSVDEPTTSTNSHAFTRQESKRLPLTLDEREAYRERRRLKKLRKDKLRQQQLQNGAPEEAAARRHKHKHKCGDDLCKHRKHKKRRKHKKHHHREIDAPTDAPSTPSIKKESNEEDEDEDGMSNGRSRKHISQHLDERLKNNAVVLLNTNDCRVSLEKRPEIRVPIIKEETFADEDMISSITEDSSGSSYVSLKTNFVDRNFLYKIVHKTD